METSDILLIGGAALAVWYFMPSASAVPPTTTGAAVTPELQDYGTLQAIGSEPILVAAQSAGLVLPSQSNRFMAPAPAQLTPAQWNTFMTQVSGIPGPQLSINMTIPVTLATYWAALISWAAQQATASVTPAASSTPATAGVSGLSGLEGLGRSHRERGNQPGRGVNSFPPPPDPSVGRYDMTEMEWQ